MKYYVLYTPSAQQIKVKNALRKDLPENRGIVFYPCMEVYRRGRDSTDISALFPGYIFVRTDMGLKDFHSYIRENRWWINTYIKELGLNERFIAGEESPRESEEVTSDLNEEESLFLDFLLGIGENAGEDVPGDGLLRMSYGYRDKSGFKVMEGPLKYFESHIVDVNVHNRKAFLDFKMKDRVVRAGFEIKPKKFWFPEKEDGVILNDGTEIDINKLKKSMTGDKNSSPIFDNTT